jgi:hypothetical protein
MKLYADSPVRRSRQMLGDLLVLGWVYVWVRTALVVRDATLALGRPGEQLSDAGTGLASQLRDAGDAVGGLPVVGDEVRAPFAGAGGAAEQMAAAGEAQVEAVHTLAFWLGLAVGAIPVLIALGLYLPMRWRFAREATAGRRFVSSTAAPSTGSDQRLELFALRAMARQPLHRLARISGDPVAAWRSGDPDVIRELAALELGESGLSVPVLPVSADNPST